MPRPLLLSAAAVLIAAAVASWSAAAQPGDSKADLKPYPTRYYVIYTDLDIDTVKEAAVRMTAMAEEYHRRTAGFSGSIKRALPFYLYSKAADYYTDGGPSGSAGVYRGGSVNCLMAIAGEKGSGQVWHVMQHEGFHQFVHSVIRGDIPVWVDEGLAEYFAEGLFTGDGFITGLVPPHRLARVKKLIDANKFKPFREMMTMSNKDWSGNLTIDNYDQAWSMMHFLAHADGGKYQAATAGFINDIGSGMRYENAWVKNFGRDVDGFENFWKKYWGGLNDDATVDLSRQASVAIIASFYARCRTQNQQFDSPEAFFLSAGKGELKCNQEQWLPPGLLASVVGPAQKLGRWSMTPTGITCEMGEGVRYVGSFAIVGGQVNNVKVELQRPTSQPASGPTSKPNGGGTTTAAPSIATQPQTRPANQPTTAAIQPAPAEEPVATAIRLAKMYRQAGKPDKARQILQDALKQNPNSPAAAEAGKLLGE